ncbi:zinc-dependent alcohol dehydrogenase [Halovulum sp. GXIMD14793]
MTTDRTLRALWITGRETAECREGDLRDAPGAVSVRTLYTGISRGTERLVFQGNVPESEYETMRAPYQEGSFPFPVKYGYAAVGQIESPDRAGETVFALIPHQTRFALPAETLCTVPANVPPARAVLAANMETALNITWDAQINIGDKIVIVGCGVVGALTAYLAAKVPGSEVTVLDTNPDRRGLSEALGCGFSSPDSATTKDADVVIHSSASAAGLGTAISMAGMEASIIEASWYGQHPVEAPLGGRFHQRRLRLVSSQVGRIPARQAARWSYHRRLTKALALLADPVLDLLISTPLGTQLIRRCCDF